ncbi:hypothetical protein AB0M12_38755 [Nocardia vinacea]|uniref:hypothetical protein n=1 Tax=Nocardia vinacea TaxID=96468 RepID=UPI003431AF0B
MATTTPQTSDPGKAATTHKALTLTALPLAAVLLGTGGAPGQPGRTAPNPAQPALTAPPPGPAATSPVEWVPDADVVIPAPSRPRPLVELPAADPATKPAPWPNPQPVLTQVSVVVGAVAADPVGAQVVSSLRDAVAAMPPMPGPIADLVSAAQTVLGGQPAAKQPAPADKAAEYGPPRTGGETGDDDPTRDRTRGHRPRRHADLADAAAGLRLCGVGAHPGVAEVAGWVVCR